MYLFTRAGRFGPGSIRDAMSFVGTVTEKVNQTTGLEVHAWMSSMSPDLGVVAWATFVEHLEQLEQANDKLAVDEGYIDLIEKNAHLYAGPLADNLRTVVHGGPQEGAALPSYVSVANAVAANGKLGQAIADGIEIATMSTEITGIQTSFLVAATGAYGGCSWNSGYESIGALEESEAKLNDSAEWIALIDRIGSSYAQGASQALYRRIV
jgi:hypothetical protein